MEYKLKKDQDMLVPGAQLRWLGPACHGHHGLEARVGYDGEGRGIGSSTMGDEIIWKNRKDVWKNSG